MRIERWIACLFSALVLATGLAAAQDNANSEKPAPGPESLAGTWTLHPQDEKAPPPPPPPIYASYRKSEPAIETLARVVFEERDGKLTAKAYFPKGILLGDDNRDVSGQPEVELKEIHYDRATLRFQAEVEGIRFEADLKPRGFRGDQFEGTFKAGEKQGRLFLLRRPE